MIFDKLFSKKSKEKMLGHIELFKQNHQEDYMFEEFMIDKNGEEVYLVVTYNEQCKLGKIHIFSYINKVEKVLFTINEDTLLIGDIQIFKNKGRGIGSKVIDILEKVAIQYNVSKIKGNLFSTDKLNRKRQIHFYTKNGFTIINNALEKELKY